MSMYWELNDHTLEQVLDALLRARFDRAGDKMRGHETCDAYIEGIKLGMAFQRDVDEMRNADRPSPEKSQP